MPIIRLQENRRGAPHLNDKLLLFHLIEIKCIFYLSTPGCCYATAMGDAYLLLWCDAIPVGSRYMCIIIKCDTLSSLFFTDLYRLVPFFRLTLVYLYTWRRHVAESIAFDARCLYAKRFDDSQHIPTSHAGLFWVGQDKHETRKLSRRGGFQAYLPIVSSPTILYYSHCIESVNSLIECSFDQKLSSLFAWADNSLCIWVDSNMFCNQG